VSNFPFLPSSFVFFGDYTNITAHDNVIRPIWARCQNSQMSIWTAIVDPGFVGIDEASKDAIPFSVEQVYPNPFAETAFISFKIHEPTRIYLVVYDEVGREVEVLINNSVQQPGKYCYQFNASGKNLSPGVYHFLLIGGEKVMRQKIVMAG
jgi:hypothetical protein